MFFFVSFSFNKPSKSQFLVQFPNFHKQQIDVRSHKCFKDRGLKLSNMKITIVFLVIDFDVLTIYLITK